MSQNYLLGVDVGTSSIKVVVIDECATVVAQQSASYRLLTPNAVSVQIDTEDMWNAFLNCLNKIDNETPDVIPHVVGIGTSCLCPGLTAFSEDGTVLVDPIIYSDGRSIEQAEAFRTTIGEDALFEITANRPMAGGMSGPTMLWIKENLPDIYQKTKYFGHVNTLMGVYLTGKFAIDHSNASYTLLYETAQRGIWSEVLCEKMGIQIEKLPPILQSTDVLGTLTHPDLLALGFSKQTQVVIGGGDTACATLAAGVIQSGDVCESVGTTNVLTFCVDEPKFSTSFINRRHVVDGKWIYQGAMSHMGSSYRWMCDNFYQDYLEATDRNYSEALTMMNRDAETVEPGASGLVFLPYMMGERSPVWDPYARGVFFGVSYRTGRNEMNRAILESCAYGMKQLLETVEQCTGREVKSFSSIGGGAKSKTWAQLKADITGRSISVLDMNDMAPVGAALLAGVGTKIFADVYEASDAVKKVVYMNIESANQHHEIYDLRYQVYKSLYPSLKNLYPINFGIKK